MNDLNLPSLIVWGILLAIAVIGLMRSNAAAARLNGSRADGYDTTGQRDDASRFSGTTR